MNSSRIKFVGRHGSTQRWRRWGAAVAVLASTPLTVLAPVATPSAFAAAGDAVLLGIHRGQQQQQGARDLQRHRRRHRPRPPVATTSRCSSTAVANGRPDDQPHGHGRRQRRLRGRPSVGERDDPRPGRPDERRRAGSTATTPSCCARAPTSSTSSARSGSIPGTEWGTGLLSTADNTLQRLGRRSARATSNGSDAVRSGDASGTGLANDTFTGLGAHTSTCGTDDCTSGADHHTGQRRGRRRPERRRRR